MEGVEKDLENCVVVTVIGTGRDALNTVNRIAEYECNPRLNFVVVDESPEALANGKGQIHSVVAEQTQTDASLKHADVIFIVTALSDDKERNIVNMIMEGAKDANALMTVCFVIGEASEDGAKSDAVRDLQRVSDGVFVMTQHSESENITEDVCKIFHGIFSLFAKPGLVGIDIMDIKEILGRGGHSFAGIGEANIADDVDIDNATISAAKSAMQNRSIAKYLPEARKILVNVISSGKHLSISAVDKAVTMIYDGANENTYMVFGATVDEKFHDKVAVTIIVTNVHGNM